MTSLCERHSLAIMSLGFCRQENALNPSIMSASTTLLNERISLFSAQCYEPAAFCLLGFYKNCPKLHLLQMLKLFVLMFLK